MVTATNRWMCLWNWFLVWSQDLVLVCWVWTPGFFLASCRFLLVSLSDGETRTETAGKGKERIGENSLALNPQSKSEFKKAAHELSFIVSLFTLTSLSNSTAFSSPLCASRYFKWKRRPSKLCQGISAALGSGPPLAQLAPSRWLRPRT